jgi:hypothetical protein
LRKGVVELLDAVFRRAGRRDDAEEHADVVTLQPLEEEVAHSDAYCVWRDGPENAVVQGFLRAVQADAAV